MAPSGGVSCPGQQSFELTGFDDRISGVLDRQVIQLHQQDESADSPAEFANGYPDLLDEESR